MAFISRLVKSRVGKKDQPRVLYQLHQDLERSSVFLSPFCPSHHPQWRTGQHCANYNNSTVLIPIDAEHKDLWKQLQSLIPSLLHPRDPSTCFKKLSHAGDQSTDSIRGTPQEPQTISSGEEWSSSKNQLHPDESISTEEPVIVQEWATSHTEPPVPEQCQCDLPVAEP